MSITHEKSDKKCKCGKEMELVWIKNPFIDDYYFECGNWDCDLAGRKQF